MKIKKLALAMGVAAIAGCGSNASSPSAAVAPPPATKGVSTAYVPPPTPVVPSLPAGAIAVPAQAEVSRYSLNMMINPTTFFNYQKGMFNASNRVDTKSANGVSCTAITRTVKWILKTDGQYVYTYEDVSTTGQVDAQNQMPIQPTQSQTQGQGGAGFSFSFGVGAGMAPMQPMQPMMPMTGFPQAQVSPTPFALHCVNVSAHTYTVKRVQMPTNFDEMQSVYGADARHSRYFFASNDLQTFSEVHGPGIDAYYLENADQTNAASMFIGAQSAKSSVTYSIQTSMQMPYTYGPNGQVVPVATPAPVTVSVTSNETRESSGFGAIDAASQAQLSNITYCKINSSSGSDWFKGHSTSSSCSGGLNMSSLLN